VDRSKFAPEAVFRDVFGGELLLMASRFVIICHL